MDLNITLVQTALSFERTYPMVLVLKDKDGVENRVLIEESAGKYRLLLKHPAQKHWSAYFLIPRALWEAGKNFDNSAAQVEAEMLGVSLSYAGHSNKFITWVTAAKNGKLVTPANILHGEQDFWVGFSTLEFKPESWTINRLRDAINAIAVSVNR